MSIRIKNKNQVVQEINNVQRIVDLMPIWDKIQDVGFIHKDDVNELVSVYEQKRISIAKKAFKAFQK